MSSIFGGSKQKSQATSSSMSNNQAYGTINDWAGGLLPYAGEGAKGLQSLLGGDTSGLNQYKQNMGFDYAAEQGSRGITGNAAAAGMLRSGGTSKGLARFNAGLNDQFNNQYMDRLLQLSGIGQNAAQTLVGAGQQSQSESQSTQSGKNKNGMGKFLGAGIGAVAASDRRLKRDIKKIGETSEGLGLYEYYYNANPFFKKVGVMADEVALKMPEALGPVVNGYMTVDYSKLAPLEEV